MNKKITALLLAAALTTGVGAYGTYAYFTDTAQVKNNVNITMGTLDVQADWMEQNWNKISVGDEASLKGTSYDGQLAYEYVKPGDIFTRKIKVQNIGNLRANVTAEVYNPYNNIFDLNVKLNGENQSTSFEIGEMDANGKMSQEITLELTVKDLNNEWQGANIGNIEADEFVKIYAEQLGADQFKK